MVVQYCNLCTSGPFKVCCSLCIEWKSMESGGRPASEYYDCACRSNSAKICIENEKKQNKLMSDQNRFKRGGKIEKKGYTKWLIIIYKTR